VRNRRGNRGLGALDARGLALALAQVVQLRAAHAALPHQLDRPDHRRMHRKNALHADAKAHASHGKTLAAQLAAAAHHHAFKRLDALLVALAFLQADVHANRVAGTENGVVLADL
jgi:hypothetical protein